MMRNFPFKIGFIGYGHLAQSLTKGWLDSGSVPPSAIFASNRSPGKLHKASEALGIQVCSSNEEVLTQADIVFLAMKPQDLIAAVEPLIPFFHSQQMVVSLAAGISLQTLTRKFPNGARIGRLTSNTPTSIRSGLIGFCSAYKDEGMQSTIADLFEPLGQIILAASEDELDTIMVSSSAGTGFVLELMLYFQDWIEEHGFETEEARKIAVQTFLGAASLAKSRGQQPLAELQNQVVSKKGITAAGLESMRELEIERALRYSFEKASLRNQELAKLS